ncbi:hypothetical protein CHLRE_05g236450v5 [Chlamydomonas reinhardtii]|uniref:Uncharacterized protein n=1 Tax=Chlamydomonas reinhardtii TaxID=3055 RepID=A0A2K3DSU3_CHLRE|nr:uncharacterized protein CHLRE_05g236450v5 [Chlamydomonas reinhardtii]PNW83600.1 hypothetical protein CHLRE_05g236450v5 [Chlamydomonas reinhardtii]
MRLWPKANASVQLQQRERLVWELALGSRRCAPAAVAAVTDRCLGLRRGAACGLEAVSAATAGSSSSSSNIRATEQWRPLMEEQPLALAAVVFLKGPLAALSELPPAQLAADVTALLRPQADVGAAAGGGRGGSR